MVRTWTALAAAMVTAACAATPQQQVAAADQAATDQAQLAKALAGLTPGKPQTCLNNYSQSQLKAYGPVLVYTVSRSLKFRSDTAGGCEGVARGDILVTRSNLGRPCAGDIAQTIDQTSRFPTGSCALGEFVEYSRK